MNPPCKYDYEALTTAEYDKLLEQTRDTILQFITSTSTLSFDESMFEWRDYRHILNDTVHFSMQKRFDSISAMELCDRTWQVVSCVELCTRLYSPTFNLKMHILQQINEDMMLIYRTVHVDALNCMAKTVYLLARITIPQGYMVLFRSIDHNQIKLNVHEGKFFVPPANDIWLEQYVCAMFCAEGPTTTQFYFGGNATTNIWMREILFIALRWEALVMGPQLVLNM